MMKSQIAAVLLSAALTSCAGLHRIGDRLLELCMAEQAGYSYVHDIVYPVLDKRALNDPDFELRWVPLKAALEAAQFRLDRLCDAGSDPKALASEIANGSDLTADAAELYGTVNASTIRAIPQGLRAPMMDRTPEWKRVAMRQRRVHSEAMRQATR